MFEELTEGEIKRLHPSLFSINIPLCLSCSELTARAAEAKRDKQWIEWGEQRCPHYNTPTGFSRQAFSCPECRQELRNQLEVKDG